MEKRCIICDLDGTLSLFDRQQKSPYDRDFENDECSEQVKFILESYQNKYPERVIFFLSGRNDKFRGETTEFFQKHFDKSFSYALAMRKDQDFRKDNVIKKEMYNKYIKNEGYKVDFVIDDRLQVCRLWWNLGLFVFNVNQGLIEF